MRIKISNIVIQFLFAFSISINSCFAQGLNSSNGKIDNLGTIKVKSGQVNIGQDTIGGRVELLQNVKNNFYMVPNIVYNELVVKNGGKQIVSDNKDKNGQIKKLTVLDSLILENDGNLSTFYIGLNPDEVLARSAVVNQASQYTGPKDLRLQNETKSQEIIANGKFSRINIDNPIGVSVKSGGFEITSKLTLSRGELKNSASANFKMADSTEIERYVGASLAVEPQFGKSVDLTYLGQGSMTTSGEVPSSKSVVRKLQAFNSDSLNLSRNVQINDSLLIKGRIFAIKDTLTLAAQNNPVFLDSSFSEIAGYFRRNNFRTGEKVLFHNLHTYFVFADDASRNGISDIVLNILPTTYPKYDDSNSKIMRSIDLNAFDAQGNEILNGFTAEFGYGWRYAPSNQNIDETKALADNFADLVLQKWSGTNYDNLNSESPQQDLLHNWAYSNDLTFSSTGSFAIGLSSILPIWLQAKVYLEGAYIDNSKGKMRTDLWNGMQGNILTSNLDKNQFPFDLIQNLDLTKIKSVPDSVVDWIVLKFTNVANPNTTFSKLLLVRYDGKIVDLNGNQNIQISKNEYNPDASTSMFELTVLHRNHASVKSLEPIGLVPENNGKVYDFTHSDFVFGGPASEKVVDLINNSKVYAMRTGYYLSDLNSQNDMINAMNPLTIMKDYFTVWNHISETGYLLYDYNLDGIITTKDYNLSWNNREKVQ